MLSFLLSFFSLFLQDQRRNASTMNYLRDQEEQQLVINIH